MGSHEEKTIPTIFHDILASDLPAPEKRLARIAQEGQTFVAAGTETTAWCLTVITFYLLETPEILAKLRTELQEAKATTSTQLEKLPYLTAIIQEGLRLSYGVCTRLPRIAPMDMLVLKDGERVWEIPANVCVQFQMSDFTNTKYRRRSACLLVYNTSTHASSLRL